MRCIRLIEPNIDENVILQSLLQTPQWKDLVMFHFDITSSVMSVELMLGLNTLDFNPDICCMILMFCVSHSFKGAEGPP